MKFVEQSVVPVKLGTEHSYKYLERPEDKTYYAYVSQGSNDIHYWVRNVFYADGKIDGLEVRRDNGAYLVVWNGEYAARNESFHKHMGLFRKSEEEFSAWSDVAKRMVRKTFVVTAQIGVLMEFGVKRRYCQIHKDKICRPFYISEKQTQVVDDDGEYVNSDETNSKLKDTLQLFKDSSSLFDRLIYIHELPVKYAEHVLPMTVAATTLLTKSVYEWQAFIKECKTNEISGDAISVAIMLDNLMDKV